VGNEFVPRKAEKRRVKLKMAVQGPSGSGKTWGSLSLVRNLWPDAKICVIDAENESASLYADRFDFDTIDLEPPFHTDRYIACIQAAVKAGYDVAIIDTITHQWDGEGGILRRKEEMDRRGGNSFTNFSTFTPEHERFKNAILQSPIHVIATMRSKQEYSLQQNDKGKQTPVKMGMAPIQRDGMDYEFAIVFDVQGNHMATASKDRTSLFTGRTVDLADPDTALALRTWLDSGTASLPTPPVSGAASYTQAANTTAKNTPISTPVGTTSSTSHSSTNNTGVFQLSGDDRVFCVPLNVKEISSANGKTYCRVDFNGEIRGKTFANTFDTKLFPALMTCKGRECCIQYSETKDGRFLNLLDLVSIGDVEYVNGTPLPEKENPIDDADIPF
jgi:hypothetical protein